MVQALGQTLGALRGLLLAVGSHRARDREELGLDPGADPARASLELRLQAPDRALEAPNGVALTLRTPLVEADDLSHDPIVDPGSDSPVEAPRRFPERSREPLLGASGRVGVGSPRKGRTMSVRRAVPPLLAVVLVLASAGPASAGGNWLDVRKDTPQGVGRSFGTWGALNVGLSVIAHTGIYVRNDRLAERLQGETFYAWLSPGGEGYEDGRLPADAIRLAPFRIRWETDAFGSVHAPFTVPAVATGEYEILVCDDPCTLPGFGEFVQGWATVFQTPTERRLFELARDRRMHVRHLAIKVRTLQGVEASLESRLDAAVGELRILRNASGPEAPTAVVRDPIVQVRAQPEASVTWWFALLAAVLGMGAGLVLRRQPAPAFFVPDTVPDDLADRESITIR